MIVQVQIANLPIYAIKSWIRKKKELISILLLKLDNFLHNDSERIKLFNKHHIIIYIPFLVQIIENFHIFPNFLRHMNITRIRNFVTEGRRKSRPLAVKYWIMKFRSRHPCQGLNRTALQSHPYRSPKRPRAALPPTTTPRSTNRQKHKITGRYHGAITWRNAV